MGLAFWTVPNKWLWHMRTLFPAVYVPVLTVTFHQHITGPELSSFAFLTWRYLLLAIQPALELDEEDIIQ